MLDLAREPGTTPRDFASLLIVARAVQYIRRTGEPIMIFSPTSANKAPPCGRGVACDRHRNW